MAERLSLWDIDDGVAFVATITNRSGIELNWSEREDLQAYLVATLWENSLAYEPGRIRKGFSTWAGIILRRRIVDWQRAKLGRTTWKFRNPDGSLRIHEREPRPQFVPLDGPDGDRLRSTLAERNGDSQAGGDLGLAGLDGERDRTRARDHALLGLEPPRRAS